MPNMDENKLGTVAGDLLVARASDPLNFVNFGGVKALDVTIDTDAERVEVQVQNRSSITGSSPLPTINVQFLENIDAEKISMLTGATVTNIAGALVAGATQVTIASAFEFNEFIEILNQNGNGSALVINSITGATNGLLVSGTDFELVKNANGKYGIVIQDSVTVTTMAQAFTINFDYTPNASVQVERIRKYANDTELIAKIVTDADVNGKINTYTLESCIFKGQYKIDVVDLAIAQDLEGTTGVFEGKRGAKITMNIETL